MVPLVIGRQMQADKHYADFLQEDTKLSGCSGKVCEAGVSLVEIERQASSINYIYGTSGIIGRGGQRVDEVRRFPTY